MEENNVLDGIEIQKKNNLKSNIIFTIISFVIIVVVTLLLALI